MEMTEYQKLLPAGLKLDRARRGAGCLGDEFEATDSRNGAAKKRLVQFLPPASTSDGWDDWPGWKPRLEAWLAERVGLQLLHVSLPVETGSTTPSGMFLVGHRHDEALSKLMAERSDAFGPAAWLSIVEQVLAGLAEMHARHLVHGDVRPCNIYVEESDDQKDDVTVWLDGPVAGALAAWSGHRVEDPESRVYRSLGVLEPAATLSPMEDLRGLALSACELALGGRQELLEHADGASSVDEFWARIEPVLRMRLARRHRPRRLGELIDQTNPVRRFITVVALLLGQPAPGPSGFGRLGPKGTWQSQASPSDASDVLRRLKSWDAARRGAQIRRLAAALAVAMVSCTLSVYLSVLVRRQATELADARRKGIEVGDQLAKAKATNVSQANRITEMERQLDEAIVNEKNEELREIRAALAELNQQVAGVPPPASGAGMQSADQAAAEDGRKARNAWEEKVTVKHPYQANDVTRLYESWLIKEPAVAARIKEWRASIEALRRRAKPWLSADAELKRLCDSASREPWEDWLGRANLRLEALRTAAGVWVNCAAPGADPDVVIRNEPDEVVQKVLKGWYQAAQTGTPWTLRIERGYAAREAGLGTTRVITVGASGRAQASTPAHDWTLAAGENQEYESEHDYLKDDANGRLAFDWRPGDAIELVLEGEKGLFNRGVLLARPNLISHVVDGPLAIWSLDQFGAVASNDENVTLQFKVVHCPGPPRGWNVDATEAKKIKQQAKKALSGAAN
ncbi:MAG TPA: hypothetical protein VND64_28685 [Pirellulales bacterium]|nr:hypothetical protein [Pirellulales bacterium]